VVSYEDRVPPVNPASLFDAPERLVVVYRSFLQWSASLLRKIQGNHRFGPLDRNRIMARAVCTYRDMLNRVNDDDVLDLCYDDWTANEGYRKAALARLELPGADLSRGTVQRFGGGSSFQGQTADVSDLKTDTRSAEMAQDHEYQLLLWTAARDKGFMQALGTIFPKDAARLGALLGTARADVVLP
jgi:hypothetical protein